MAFDNSFTAVVGATYTAAQYNTHVRDNFTAVWVYTAAGDIAYATSSSALSRLAKPSVDSVLKMGSLGVPSWLALTDFPGRLHTFGSNFSNSGSTSASTSYVAIGAGISFNLTLTATCTILAFAFGRGSKNTGAADGYFGIRIDGTQDPSDKIAVKSTVGENFSTYYHRTGIVAGTRTVELRYRTASGADLVGCSLGGVVGLAFAE